ncbi:MAG: protein kinase domain-containing protein [Gemmataceae bacterium]
MTAQTCPSDDRLAALLAGRLPADQSAELSRHLETCSQCTAAAARLGGAAATVPPDATVPPVTDPLATGPDLGRDTNLGVLAPPQAPGELGRLGSYRVLKVLGKGGMGLVLQAEDPKLSRLCALKVMLPDVARRPEMKERFLREARAAAQVEHEHIIPIYQVDEDRGVPYIAMPFLKGSSLEDWLVKKRGPLPVREILKLGREMAKGLAAAHERGLIHRDIKPANVWLDSTAGGKVKILDFGLARLASRNDGGNEKNLTQTGMILGTPAYMAPEQAQGLRGNVDTRADLFSLGCILYRLCTGVAPFRGDDIISTLVSVAMDNPPPPIEQNPGIPLALSELVMRLLAKNRDGRPASAHDVVKSLQAIEKGLQAAAPANQPEAPMPVEPEHAEADRDVLPARKPRRMRVGLIVGGVSAVIVMAIVMAIVVAVAGVVMFWQTPKGVVRVEIADDAKIKVAVDQEEFTIHGAGPHDIKVRPGSHGLRVRLGDLEFQTRKFDVTKGETVLVRIEQLDGKVLVVNDGNIIGSADVPSPGVVARPKELRPKEVPPKEVPPAEARPNSSPPQVGAALKTIAGWGDVVDPDGDCKVTAAGGKVTLQLPGGVHNLQMTRQNSPRVLQDVEGDFSVQVKVAVAIRTDIGTTAPGAKSPALRAGTLLIWQDAKNFIRLERESRVIDGKSLPLCWLEPYGNGKTLFTDGQNHGIAHMEIVPDQLTHLRLERRQGKFNAAYSEDGGTTWKPIGPQPFAMDLGAKVRVGVSAINTTVVPLTVEFENLVIANDRVGPVPFGESFRNKFDLEFVGQVLARWGERPAGRVTRGDALRLLHRRL